jgi:hypothetical protein
MWYLVTAALLAPICYKSLQVQSILETILPRILVTIDGVSIVIGFIDHVQVVTTNECNTVADFHTANHSTLDLLSLLLLIFVTALNNGYTFTVFSLSVSWQWISLELPHTGDILSRDSFVGVCRCVRQLRDRTVLSQYLHTPRTV